jgi:Terminase large subunit, T4likevirus-type, N-terminal
MMENKFQVLFQPQPGPQTEFIRCPCSEVFFGGARGGGKSFAVLLEWAQHAAAYGENAIGLVVRRERTQLIELIQESKRIYGPIGATFNEVTKGWRFSNGARLRFAYLDNDSDASIYQGQSFSRIYVEEITNFPSPEPIMKLMATLRSGAGVPCGFRCTGNPGGPGHHWVKARYIDPCPTGLKIIESSFSNPWTDEIVTRDRVYIPARLKDNKYLGPEYVANLQMSGSPEIVRAWLHGDFNISVEGSFFPEFGDRHIIPPFSIPSGWMRFRAMDWGSASPFSVGWYAVAQDESMLSGTQTATVSLFHVALW